MSRRKIKIYLLIGYLFLLFFNALSYIARSDILRFFLMCDIRTTMDSDSNYIQVSLTLRIFTNQTAQNCSEKINNNSKRNSANYQKRSLSALPNSNFRLIHGRNSAFK